MTRREAPVTPPTVLTIAGSDSGGGAGIQADLKTIEACGGFGTSAITSVTAQNTLGVQRSHRLPIEDIDAQIDAVLDDFDVAAVKTGMLATSDVVDLVTSHAADLPNLVVDPVMVATSGDRLLTEAAEAAYANLLAEATLVTPNADEAAVLTGVDVTDPDSAERAGRILVAEHGADAALVKGGHVPGDHVVDTLVSERAEGECYVTTFRHDRVDTNATHGAGCTLSSAIATSLAHGDSLTTAVGAGIDLLTRAVRYNVDVGEGPGAVHHLVELRNDASRHPTVDLVVHLADRLADEFPTDLVAPAELGLAGATPHAEAVADIATLVGWSSDEDTATAAPQVRFGGDDPLASVLLAAREAYPPIRYATCIPETAERTDTLADEPVRLEGASLDGNRPVPAGALVPLATLDRRPVVAVVGDPVMDDDRSLVLFGVSAGELEDRLGGLVTA